MVQQQRRIVEPGELVRGRVQVRNTGNVPALLGVRTVSGSSGLFGFAPGAQPVTVTTPGAVRPGETAELRVAIRVPQTPGDAAFQVELGAFDPSGQLTQILDRQLFAGLAEVMAAIPVAPPGPPVTPPVLSAEELAEQFMESLGTPTLTVSPREVNPGQTVRATFQVSSSAPASFTPQLRLVLLDANDNVVRTVFDQRLTAQRGIPISRQVDINTTGLAPGSYGLRPFLIDPITNLVLLNPGPFRNLFSVLAAAAPPTIPTPVTVPSITSLNLGAVTASPLSVNPGDVVNFSIPLSLPQLPPGTPQPELVADIFVIRSLGGGQFAQAARLVPEQSISLPLATQRWTVPQGAEAGDYGLSIRVWDRRTLADVGFLVQQQLPNLFRVVSVAAPTIPVPTGPQPLTSLNTLSLQASFVPDNMRRGNLVIRATNRNPFPVRLRFVAPLVTPTFAFAADIIPRPGVERTISPNQTATIEQSFSLPLTLPAGNYTISLEIIDALSGSAFAALRSPGQAPVLRLTTGAPPAPAPAPAPTPIGPPAPELLSVAAPTLTPANPEAGDIITGEWTLRNPLTQPLRAFLFLDGPVSSPDQRNGVARDFAPGQTQTLRVIARVPPAQPAGRVTYGLAVRDASTQQTIGTLVRTVTLTVQAPPAPTPAPTGMGLTPGQLLSVAIGPLNEVVLRGNDIGIQFTLRNTSGNSGSLRIQAFGQDPSGNTRGTGETSVSIGPFQTINPRVNIPIPSNAATGRYGVRVFIWDTATFVPGDVSTFLIRQTTPDVFTVR